MAVLTSRQVAIGGATALLIPVGVALSGLGTNVETTSLVGLAAPGPTEIRQGIMTCLAQLEAEGLMLSWAQVRVEHALALPAWPNPHGNPIFGAQLTGGSISIRGWYLPRRNRPFRG